MAAGLFMLSVPTETVFKLGLATIIVGNGLFKPIISTLVGKLYLQGDARRDAGFTIFYMGINLGAFICNFVCGTLAAVYGWHYGFGAAGHLIAQVALQQPQWQGFGLALQAGFDYWLDNNWGVNLDVKYIDLNVDVSVNNGALHAYNVDLNPVVVGAGVSYRF